MDSETFLSIISHFPNLFRFYQGFPAKILGAQALASQHMGFGFSDFPPSYGSFSHCSPSYPGGSPKPLETVFVGPGVSALGVAAGTAKFITSTSCVHFKFTFGCHLFIIIKAPPPLFLS